MRSRDALRCALVAHGGVDQLVVICRINVVPAAEIAFAGEPSSVGDARRFARAVLEAGNVSDDDWTAVQIISELATNAVVHARTAFTVKIEYDDVYIKVSVIDAKPLARASVRRFSDITTTGRGLRLVQLLGESWGVEQTPTTKAVWCKLRRGVPAADDVEVAFDAMSLAFERDDAASTDDPQVRGRAAHSGRLVAT
jgi:anti-sigma regulatory factor (Ser/Thr protein kinase)